MPALAGDDGVVYLTGESQIAFDAVTGTTRWTASTAGWPIEPLRGGGAAILFEAAAPTMTPPGGVYASPQVVTLASATPGAVVRYTLDGSVPDETSTIYTEPLVLGVDTVVTARAFRADWTASPPVVAAYTFGLGTLDPPVAIPPRGTYADPPLVTLTAAVGATIRYTLDGTDPTEASPAYLAPLVHHGDDDAAGAGVPGGLDAEPERGRVLHAERGHDAADPRGDGDAGGQRGRLAPHRRDGDLHLRGRPVGRGELPGAGRRDDRRRRSTSERRTICRAV